MTALEAAYNLHAALMACLCLLLMGFLSLSNYRHTRRENEYRRSVKLQELRTLARQLLAKKREGIEA